MLTNQELIALRERIVHNFRLASEDVVSFAEAHCRDTPQNQLACSVLRVYADTLERYLVSHTIPLPEAPPETVT